MAPAAQKPLQRKLVLENLALELFSVTYHPFIPRRASCKRSIIDGSHFRRLRSVITCSGFCSRAAAKGRVKSLAPGAGACPILQEKAAAAQGWRRYLVKGQKGDTNLTRCKQSLRPSGAW